ncbi:MAG: hypothetical protein U9N35_05970, partial [Euryarchaeota archaeon]|nr:hypothetical protein [Euryarchaeota archaeon]
MRWEDTKQSIKEFLFEFKQKKIGVLGITFLVVLVTITLIAPFIASPKARENWRSMAYWDENPVNAPPAWQNYFSKRDMAPHLIMEDFKENVTDLGEGITQDQLVFTYNYPYDVPPTDLTLKMKMVYYNETKKPSINVSMHRPDGKKVKLYSKSVSSGKQVDDHFVSSVNVLLTKSDTTKEETYNFGRKFESKENMEEVLSPSFVKPMRVLFSKTEPGILIGDAEPLNGEYKLVIDLFFFDGRDSVRSAKAIFAGKVYGLLGTDDSRRNLFEGLIWGTQWALILGLLTAFITVSLGISFGITSAYLG